jgi:hypothetical protein
LQSLTGFRAKWSLADGLTETIRFYAPQLLGKQAAAA